LHNKYLYVYGYSKKKKNRHDIAEILLPLALSTNQPTNEREQNQYNCRLKGNSHIFASISLLTVEELMAGGHSVSVA
jgi:hypothetical protein